MARNPVRSFLPYKGVFALNILIAIKVFCSHL
jgi:hypothetical protein